MDEYKVAIVIPAFNEENTIESVIKSVKPYGKAIVVNDGSIDKTSEIAEKSGALVVNHNTNQGYDAALNSGIKKAVEEKFNAVITFDADGQHSADLLTLFIQELKNGTQLVLGVRPNNQRFAEWLFGVYAKYRFNWLDPLCGMKGYSASLINEIDNITTYESIGTELALRSIKRNLSVMQIPIKDIKRIGSSKFGDGFLANLKIFKALLIGIIKFR
jgi:glycosyltransferase involved in cell wall biosynthesis